MVLLVGHREPKGAATEMPHLSSPRQSSTLPSCNYVHSDPYAQFRLDGLGLPLCRWAFLAGAICA
jgi:hypothetical protein